MPFRFFLPNWVDFIKNICYYKIKRGKIIMYCPLTLLNSPSERWNCYGTYCGLWDKEKNQCALTTFLTNNNKEKD